MTIKLLCMGACLIVLAGCKKEKEPEPVVTDNKAELLSFGFYTQENPALDENYVVDNPTSSMEFRIPAEVNKTALKARFTVSDDDIVTIGTTVLKSGVTAFDCNLPLDITVKDTVANVSTVYSLAVKKILTMVWSQVGTYFEGDYTSDAATSMAVHPSTGEPYIFYAQLNATTTNKGSVIKWNGTGFAAVGSKEFTGGRIYNPRIKFAANGTPYVMYSDNSTDPINMPTIMNYSGSSWSVVGEAGYGERMNTSYGHDFVVYGSDNKIVSIYTNNAAGIVPNREMNVAYWSGSSWSSNQIISILPSVSGTANAVVNQRMAKYENTVYLVAALNGGGYTVLKYDGTSWSALADRETFGGNVGIFISDIAIGVDNAGAVHIAVPDNANNQIRVVKYSATAGTWSVLGGGPVERHRNGTNFSLTFDKNNTPFLLYTDYDGSLYNVNVVTIDETTLWTPPTLLHGDTYNGAVSIAADANGAIYALFPTRNTAPSTYYTYHLHKFAMEADE